MIPRHPMFGLSAPNAALMACCVHGDAGCTVMIHPVNTRRAKKTARLTKIYLNCDLLAKMIRLMW